MENTQKVQLVRFITGPRKGRYHLQVSCKNDWGFSLIAEDGYTSPGGFDFGNASWVVSKRKWPQWAVNLMSEVACPHF